MMLPLQLNIILSTLLIKLTAGFVAMYFFDQKVVHTPQDVDLDFDVMYGIYYVGPNGDMIVVGTAILLDNYRFLSSFNPFRRVKGKKLQIYGLRGRTKVKNVSLFSFKDNIYVDCFRQVIHVGDEDIAKQNYTGDNRNNPLHDLAVLKGGYFPDFVNVYAEERFHGWKWFENPNIEKVNYPYYTIDIAGKHDKLSDDFKIGSLEHRYIDKILDVYHFRFINVIHFSSSSFGLTDCELWFPREWGYFICVHKPRNVVGLASGAVLISNRKVFGIGSFALNKGQEGIYVFTDVRPYEEHIKKTCTDEDKP